MSGNIRSLPHPLPAGIGSGSEDQKTPQSAQLDAMAESGAAGKLVAIKLGLFLKSYWPLLKTLDASMGLSNAYFEEIEPISLRTVWYKIHNPATLR